MKESVLSALFVALGSGLAIGLQSTLTNWAGRLIGPIRSGLLTTSPVGPFSIETNSRWPRTPWNRKLRTALAGVTTRGTLETYTRGLSTRDVEDAFREATGNLQLTRAAASVLIDQLWADYQAFGERESSQFQVEYLVLDRVYESPRRLEGLHPRFAATGIASTGAGDN